MSKHKILMILWMLLLLNPMQKNFAQETKTGPAGRYCGEVFHAGYIVKVETTLKLGANGKLTGSMRYDDQGHITTGTITELNSANGTKRNVQWQDMYGVGLAVLTFDEKYDTFEGLWGTGLERPRYRWTGAPCHDYTS